MALQKLRLKSSLRYSLQTSVRSQKPSSRNRQSQTPNHILAPYRSLVSVMEKYWKSVLELHRLVKRNSTRIASKTSTHALQERIKTPRRYSWSSYGYWIVTKNCGSHQSRCRKKESFSEMNHTREAWKSLECEAERYQHRRAFYRPHAWHTPVEVSHVPRWTKNTRVGTIKNPHAAKSCSHRACKTPWSAPILFVRKSMVR